MSVSAFNVTYYGSTSVSIPSNTRNVTIILASTRGGDGGADGGNGGGGGNNGRYGAFRYYTEYVTRNLTFWMGGAGGNGVTNAVASGGGGGGGGPVPGGRGGNTGSQSCGDDDRGYSGGGGGGGSATVVLNASGSPVICAGGGGGGGGGSWERGGGSGGAASGWNGGIGGVSGGGAGGDAGCDGGGGGGGGGGAPGGGGGGAGRDRSYGSGGGGGGTSAYNSGILQLTNDGAWGGSSGFVQLYYEIVTPQINSFFASPNPLTSSSGTPQYSTVLYWSVVDCQYLTITGPGFSGTYGAGSGSAGITMPQSVAGSSSPATRTYTLTAYSGTVTRTAFVTVSAYNDNNPSFLTVASNALPGNRSLSNLEPNTTYYVQVNFGGVDMNTFATPSSAGTRVSTNASNWSGSPLLIPPNNGAFYVQFTSQPFNTSTTPGGTVNGETVGQTNSKTISFSFGTGSLSFTATTRAPVIQETFNSELTANAYPFPDIDTLTPDPTSVQYAVSSSLSMNDIEIPVEIKTNDPNSQVRVNSGAWRDMRQA